LVLRASAIVAAGIGLLILALAQTPAVRVPFFTTPSLGQFTSSSAGITLLARQPDQAYAQLKFGVAAPYGLLSSMASLAAVISGTTKFSMNTPAGPANVGRASQIVAAGDFTGDDSPGVVYVDVGNNANGVAVYLGTPLFAFRNTASYPVGAYAAGAIAADFNRDGKTDLAVVNLGDNPAPGHLSILLNNGDGTFASPVAYSAGGAPISLAVLDVNHDGILDIAVADNGGSAADATGAVYVLLGKGDGTFGTATSYTAGENPLSVTIADFNGDGNPDLAVTAEDNSVTILAGSGNGTFRAGASFQAGNSPQYLAAGDLNGDGKLDLAVANTNDNTISIFVGKGDGTFQLRATYITSFGPNSLVIADYNGDGKPDILQASGDARLMLPGFNSDDIDILLGNGDGTFQGASTYTPGPTAGPLLGVSDFNSDGKADVVMTDGTGRPYLFAGNGNGTFQQASAIAAPAGFAQGGPAAAAAGDFNGDGKPDLAVTETHANSIAVLLNAPGGLQAGSTISSGGNGPAQILSADFDGDGKADLALVNGGTPNLAILTGTGNGSFQVKNTYGTTRPMAAIAAADLNGDGRPDLIAIDGGQLGTTTHGAVWVYLNDGKGGLGTPAKYMAVDYPGTLAAGDVNGDGKPDIVAAGQNADFSFRVAVFLGNGDGTFQQAKFTNTDFGPQSIAIRDFDGVGSADLVVAHCCGDTDMTFLSGNGDGTFQPEVHFIGGASPGVVFVADLTGAGHADLVIGGEAAGGQGAGFTPLLNNATPRVVIENAASYAPNAPVAPGSMAVIGGAHLATEASPPGATPGTNLGGTTVTLSDAGGVSQQCLLIYVSPQQIDLIIPDNAAAGDATVTVQSGDGVVSSGTVTIAPVAPGIYTADGRIAAAFVVHYDQAGNAAAPVFTTMADPSHAGQFLANPISLDPQSDSVYLFLYGTGIRGAPPSQVSIQAGGMTLTPAFAGAQGQYPGLDQVNVLLPYALKGAGDVAITVTAAGTVSNTVHVTIQ
jgi:uncharacterized protein (TIGR03437 family)